MNTFREGGASGEPPCNNRLDRLEDNVRNRLHSPPMPRTLALLCAATLAAAEAHAFGPGVHAYIAMRMLGSGPSTAVYGAMAADMNGILRADPAAASAMQRLTHYEFALLPPSLFATGWATHNGEWGADRVAHEYLRSGHDPEAFFTRKIRTLSEREGITQFQAEDLFDAALDLMLAQRIGPRLGIAVAESAALAGITEEDALAAAFTAPLAGRAGLDTADAEFRIRWAHRCMKSGLVVYGRILERDRGYQRPIADFLAARHFKWTAAEARAHLDTALELAQDCIPELDAIADSLAQRMRGEAAYGDYLLGPLTLQR